MITKKIPKELKKYFELKQEILNLFWKEDSFKTIQLSLFRERTEFHKSKRIEFWFKFNKKQDIEKSKDSNTLSVSGPYLFFCLGNVEDETVVNHFKFWIYWENESKTTEDILKHYKSYEDKETILNLMKESLIKFENN